MILLLLLTVPEWEASLLTDKVKAPFATAFDRSGRCYFVEYQGHRLGMIDEQQRVVYLAGNGKKGDENGMGLEAMMNAPHNLAIGKDGRIYLADTFNHKIKVYDPYSKTLTTFAGTGKAGFSGDGGPARDAQFNETYHIAFDPAGENLFVVDLKNQRVRKIAMESQRVTSVAGSGKKGTPQDGKLALESPLNDPRALIVDKEGQLFLLQRGGNDLWKVDTQGKLTRLAGTGTKGFSGDGGPALQAQLNGPKHLCFDNAGNILIADTENHCIRRWMVKTGMIELVAGRGTSRLPTKALELKLNHPHGVTVQPKTNHIYIADSSNNRIVVLKP